MKRRAGFLILLLTLLHWPVVSFSANENPRTGFPIANFGIGAEVSPSGRLLGRIVYNPPVLGQWLEDVAEGHFSFEADGHALKDEEFEVREVSRRWPFAEVKFSDHRLSNLVFDFSAFAPVGQEDQFVTSLPVILAELTVNNTGDEDVHLMVVYHCEGRACESGRVREHEKLWIWEGSALSVASADRIEMEKTESETRIQWRLTVPGNGNRQLRILFCRFHWNGYYTKRVRSSAELSSSTFERWAQLRAATQEFSDAIPHLDNTTLNEALRWYMTAGILLTKLTRNGEVLTMGYSELNQRDSYWTSFVHLVYWPELEKKMIEESATAQREDGKIPTTILPVIERNDDIDINCYFVLRVFRWTAYTGETELLKRLWPEVKAAIEFVRSMDIDGDGLPDQKSFWADWKDIPGVEGRKYGPHFILLWLAVLNRAAYWAEEVNDVQAAENYRNMYEEASVAANKHVSDGGLWNGKFYVNTWYDGRPDDHVLEDQVVGILFDVVDDQRSESIYNALQANEGEWGVRETFPYYPESFGLDGGDYHNGAVWPYLNFVDALSRLRRGRTDDGIRILEKVARADLFLHGDFLPHENINGETGENTHKYLQGWNAAFFAAVYFGLIHTDSPLY